MARIPDDVIERLKREVSLEALVRAKGIALKKHGENFLGKCPFHADKTPSFVVTPSKNLFHCMGACQTGGTVIDFVMKLEGVSFPLAVEMLKKGIPSLAASSEETPRRPVKVSTTVKLEPLASADEADDVVIERVLAHYTSTLKQSSEAQKYLESRGLSHPEMLAHFRIGYANRTLGYHVPRGNRVEGEALRSQLTRLGFYRETGREHFYGCITVPIFDAAGALTQMYGRRVTSPRDGISHHLYMGRPHSSVWNAAALAESRDVILCEALLDALTFWSAGFRHVVSSYGVEGFTRAHVEALKAHRTERVLIAYDRDDAGDKAAEKLAQALAAEGIEVFRVLFPRGMDANEYARSVKPAEKALDAAIRGAKWLAGTRPVVVAEKVEVSVSESKPEPTPSLAAKHEDETVREDVANAAPAPSLAAAPATQVTSDKGEAVFTFGPRTWRIRGLDKVTSVAAIKVNLRVSTNAAFFMDTLDVCQARARGSFTQQAAGELEIEERVLKHDMARVLNELEAIVEAQLRKALEPQKQAVSMSAGDEAAALALLRDPKVLDRIVEDFERCGVVGEETNKLVAYLAAISRKLEEPLAIVIQSSSAAGKSSLMDAVLRFVPEEEQVSYSAMTGQSLFYMGATDLQHKVLAIAEEEGATNAAYALKILQSAGELTIASPGKDPATGRLVTQEYRVTGPVMVMLTTTSIDIDEELLNRCLILTVDEGAAQTQAIQRMQREARTLEGMRSKLVRGEVMALHQNAQRLLKPISVVNPFAPELSFASHATRTRRDHKKYLALIDAIALLHQHQRPTKTAQVGSGTLKYIEVTREDIAIANKLAERVLSRGLDELAPQTRRLLGIIEAFVSERARKDGVERSDVRFTQREVRSVSGWGSTQIKVHMKTLQDLEYLAVHRSRHAQRFLYELCVSADGAPNPFEPSEHTYDQNRSAIWADRSATGRSEKRPVLSRDFELIGQPVGDLAGTIQDAPESPPYVHRKSDPEAAE